MLASAASRVASAFSRRPPHAKLLAAELDFRAGCALLQLNEHIVAGCPPEDHPRVYQEAAAAFARDPLPKLLGFANDSMTIQLSELFQHLHDVDAGDVSTPARAPTLGPGEKHRSAAFAPSIGPSTHTNPLPTLRMQMKSVYEESMAESAVAVRHQLQARAGHSLWLGPSQAATGPYAAGVYLRGRVAPGTVVGLFPGLVYNGEMLQKAVDCGHLANPTIPRTLVPRFDEAVLDAFGGGGAPRGNPYALAHHVRHPPDGVAPNVMRLQYDFMDAAGGDGGSGSSRGIMAFPEHLRDYVPNAWGSNVGTGQALYASLEQGVWAKGSVLLALRPLWDEELFVDHTLNPYARAAKLIPAWAEGDWEARRELRMLSGRVSARTAEAARRLADGSGGGVGRLGSVGGRGRLS
jgi:hypothetical protein